MKITYSDMREEFSGERRVLWLAVLGVGIGFFVPIFYILTSIWCMYLVFQGRREWFLICTAGLGSLAMVAAIISMMFE